VGLAGCGVLAAGNVLLGYEGSVVLSLWPVAVAGCAAVVLRPSWGIYAAILSVPLETATLPVGGGQLTPAKALLLLTAVVLAVRWAREGARRSPHPAHLAVAATLVLALLSVTVARDSGQALKICFVALAYTVVSLHVAGQGRGEIERILRCVVLSAGIVGIVAALTTGPQQLLGDNAVGRAQAGFAQPNVFGVFLLLSIAPGLALSFRGGAVWRWTMRLCTAAAVAGLGLSLSRASIVGTVVTLGVLAAWPVVRRGLIAVILLSITLLVFAPSLLTSSPQITRVGQRLSTLASGSGTVGGDRAALRATAPRMIADHPLLGVGEGNFANYSFDYKLYSPDGAGYDHAHNLFLTIGVELGVGGMLLLAVLVVSLAAACARACTRDRRGRRDPLALALAGVFLGLLVESLGDYPLRTDVVLAVLLIEMGAVIALARQRTGEINAATLTNPAPHRLTPSRISARAPSAVRR